MKTVKSLLLGSAAGFVALTGAQAADLPMAEPVEYVKICSTYGEGFFYIPGTDTCLQIGGRVRVQIYYEPDNNADDDTDPTQTNFFTDVDGNIFADARSETEWGTLRGYVEFEGQYRSFDTDLAGPNIPYSGGTFSTEPVAAFLQFAGITAGHTSSFYDFVEYNHFVDFFSSEDVTTVAYTASFGSGFAATIGIEDKAFRAIPDDDFDGTPYALPDQVWPNIVAALRVDQAWGSAQISAAVQDNQGDLDLAGDDIGWAVQAGVKFNVPFFNEGSYVWAQGAYSEGAVSYAGAEELTQDFVNFSAPGSVSAGTGTEVEDSDLDLAGVDDMINNTLWTVGGGVGIQATETVALNLGGVYYNYETTGGGAFDFAYLAIEGNAIWTPVDNLDLGLAVVYGTLVEDGGDDDPDGDEQSSFQVIGKLERSF